MPAAPAHAPRLKGGSDPNGSSSAGPTEVVDGATLLLSSLCKDLKTFDHIGTRGYPYSSQGFTHYMYGSTKKENDQGETSKELE